MESQLLVDGWLLTHSVERKGPDHACQSVEAIYQLLEPLHTEVNLSTHSQRHSQAVTKRHVYLLLRIDHPGEQGLHLPGHARQGGVDVVQPTEAAQLLGDVPAPNQGTGGHEHQCHHHRNQADENHTATRGKDYRNCHGLMGWFPITLYISRATSWSGF